MDGLWLFYPLYYVSQYVISGCMPGMHCVNPKKPDLQTPSCQGFPLGPAGLVEHLAMRSMASMMSACGNMAMPILGSSQLRDLRFLDLRANEPNAKGNSQFSHFQWVGKSFIGCFFYGLIFLLGRHPWIDANAKRYCTEVFDYLTLNAIAWILGAILGIQRASSCRVFDIVRPAGICRIQVENSIFCVHGGLSPDVRSWKIQKKGRKWNLGWISPKIFWSNKQVHIYRYLRKEWLAHLEHVGNGSVAALPERWVQSFKADVRRWRCWIRSEPSIECRMGDITWVTSPKCVESKNQGECYHH